MRLLESRYHDPTIGRFIQPDSIVPAGVQGYDRYAYANNNPILYNDPTGYVSCSGSNWDDGPQCKLKGDSKDQYDRKKHPEHFDPKRLWDDQFPNDCGLPGMESCLGQFIKYYSFTFGTTIPNPVTGTVIGWHATISLDQYYDWYFGLGLDAGKSLFGVSGSLVSGTFTKNQLPVGESNRKAFIESFLTGNSIQGDVAPIIYLGGNYSVSSNKVSFEPGMATPQLGLAWTYMWEVSRR